MRAPTFDRTMRSLPTQAGFRGQPAQIAFLETDLPAVVCAWATSAPGARPHWTIAIGACQNATFWLAGSRTVTWQS